MRTIKGIQLYAVPYFEKIIGVNMETKDGRLYPLVIVDAQKMADMLKALEYTGEILERPTCIAFVPKESVLFEGKVEGIQSNYQKAVLHPTPDSGEYHFTVIYRETKMWTGYDD